jgi:DMSO reductase family type II enzyme heme b subunit
MIHFVILRLRSGQARHSLLITLAVLVLAILANVISLRAGPSVSASPPLDDVAEGKKIYETRCQYCHGAEGKGDGPGAAVMYPRPRDFTSGAFKIHSTESGDPPTDADLVKVVSDGLPGTTMPAWRAVLKDAEIKQVIAYIKTFDSTTFDPNSPPKPMSLPASAPASSQAAIDKGRTLFQDLQCWKCHGQAGRGDGPSAFELKDKLGNKIFPADLTMPWNFRGGATALDIFRTLSTGLTGTPMPSFADSTSDEERWALVYFIQSLAPSEKKPEVKAVLVAKHLDGALPGDGNSDLWKQADRFFFPFVGQLVHEPRLFTPAIDSAYAQALYNDNEIAFLISWDDRVENKDANADDGFSIQFPNVIPTALEKPNFLLGDADHPVNLWQWQASGGKIEEANATGLDSITPQKADSQSVQGTVTFKDGQYRMVVKRSLKTNDSANDLQFAVGKFIPIALSAWDGGSGEGGAKRSLSSWYSLYLEQPTPPSAYLSIPIAMAAVAFVEGAVVWLVRRGTRKKATRSEQ